MSGWLKGTGTMSRQVQLVSMSQPNSIITEQYRVLFSKIENLGRQTPHRILAITSSVTGEGKTSTAVNLAIVMARDFNQRVLLIEADLKMPTFHTFLKEPVPFGFDHLLREDPEVNTRAHSPVLVSFAHDNLTLLPVSEQSRDSSALFRPGRLEALLDRLKGDYDYVLLDSPPVLPMADINRIAHVVDGIIFVVAAGMTPISLVKRAVSTIEVYQRKIVGTVLTQSDIIESKYFQGYHARD